MILHLIKAQWFVERYGMTHAALRAIGRYHYHFGKTLHGFHHGLYAWGCDAIIVSS
jgi:hypothetical protein